jgi:imidazoleglycerol phosphate dehydratase HisB
MQEDQVEKNLYVESEDDEYLTRCVVDTSGRRFNLYSNLGTEKVVVCEDMNEFMNVLTFVKDMLEDSTQLVYADPL